MIFHLLPLRESATLFVGKIEARAYSRATEVVDRVKTAILNVFPEEYHHRVKVHENRTKGHLQSSIVVVTASIEAKKGCEASLEHILGSLSEDDRRALNKTLDLRLDENCTLFLRIDKQASLLGQVRLINGPDTISVRIHLRQYPRCVRDDAMAYLSGRLIYTR
ncbi:MAG: RNA-binding domain-containing protein [Candidatus Thorarchaeota archaeon]